MNSKRAVLSSEILSHFPFKMAGKVIHEHTDHQRELFQIRTLRTFFLLVQCNLKVLDLYLIVYLFHINPPCYMR